MDPVVASDRRFKKRRKVGEAEGAGWTTLQEGYSQAALRETTPPPPEDEEPQVMGGLMTASQLQAKQSREEKATRARLAQLARETNPEEEKKSQQTIYRDSTGRAIDTLAEKALAEKKKKEREAKEIDKLQWGKGMVQKANAAETRKEMLRMKDQGFRGREDEKMNEELKGKQVWNDPAAQFLSVRLLVPFCTRVLIEAQKNKSKGPKRPEYTGAPPPPNRFGIKPGYRWDGVDRSTGFEKKFFQSRNEKRREGLESYQWGAEDM